MAVGTVYGTWMWNWNWLPRVLFWCCANPPAVECLFFEIKVIAAAGFAITATSHTNIATDANAAALFGEHLTERGASLETRELLSRVNGDRSSFDLQTMRNMGTLEQFGVLWRLGIHIIHLLQLFVQ
jgi:hypothetical protein